MALNHTLRLHEEARLLAHLPEKGRSPFGSTHVHALAGGVLGELLLEERVRVEGEKRKARLMVVQPRQLGDPLVDEWLERMRSARKPAAPATWAQRIAGGKHLDVRVTERLCALGLLRPEERRSLWVFKVRRHALARPDVREEIVGRLRHAIVSDGPVDDPRTVVLVALVKAAGMVVDRATAKARKARLKALAEGQAAGEAAAAAVAAAQAAAMVASAVAASTAASSAAASG